MFSHDDFIAAAKEQTPEGIGAAIIDGFSVAQDAGDSVYRVLRDELTQYCNTQNYTSPSEAAPLWIASREEAYIKLYWDESRIAAVGGRSKKGKLFMTKLLPPSYVNVRNTLIKALELGIPIDGKAKSQLEKECAALAKGLGPGLGSGSTSTQITAEHCRKALDKYLALVVAYERSGNYAPGIGLVVSVTLGGAQYDLRGVTI